MSLYGLQAGNVLVPLLTFPFLARNLMPREWAVLLTAQALSILVSTIVEYGHNITATRKIALAKSREEVQSTTFLTYFSKLLLCVIATLFIIFFYTVRSINNISLELAVIGLLLGVLQGSLPTWYFQGSGRARIGATVDMIFKIIASLLMVVVAIYLHTPESIILMQLTGVGATWIILTRMVWKESYTASIAIPNLREIVSDLKQGSPVFIFRILGASYTSALALMLNFVVSPVTSALILGADRIAKVAPTFIMPLCQGLYPKIIQGGFGEGQLLIKAVALIGTAVFLVLMVLSILLFIFRDPIVLLILGDKYSAASSILSYTVWLVPFIGWNTVIIQLYLFPEKMDSFSNTLLFLNATISIAWIFFMKDIANLPIYSAGLLIGELVISISLIAILSYRFNILDGQVDNHV